MMNLLNSIELRNAWWLLLMLQPVVMWGAAALLRYRQRDRFADPHLLPWVRNARATQRSTSRVQHWLLLLAWAVLAVAMAGPRVAEGVIERGEDRAGEVFAVVDVSRSMAARDIAPSRIERSRLELVDLIDRMQDMRLGIIVFAARAHVMVPPTADKQVLRHASGLLRARQLPTEGSDVVSALRFAARQFAASDQPRAIVLISDGEWHITSADALQAVVTELKQAGIPVFVLGVGTAQGAPLLDDEQGWLQYDGRAVVTRLDRERLQTLADASNGRYSEVRDDDSDWQLLYQNGLAQRPALRRATDAGDRYIWRDLSAWFIWPGVVLLLLAHLQLPALRRVTFTVPIVVLSMALSVSYPPPVQADEYADAYALYEAGKYPAAAQAFARLPGYAARLAEGIAHYHAQAWPQAAAGFIQATLEADTDQARAHALFNLANTYFKQKTYAQAAQVYEDVLRYAPHWHAAQINLDYARALQQKDVEALPTAAREGTGIRSARVADNVDITQGRLSIDGSESTSNAGLPAAGEAQQLNPAGRLQQAAPAATQIVRDADVTWTYDITRADALQAQHIQFSVDESLIWQRLYEEEEGFAAPQSTPHAVPGVDPW